MRFNPRLFHKLIAIGMAPLIFEVVLAVCLFSNLAAAESQAINERKARQASADLNDLYQKITGAAQMVGTMLVKDSDTVDVSALNGSHQSMLNDLQDIGELVGDDAPVKAQLGELEQTVEASLHMIDEAVLDVRSHNRVQALVKMKFLRASVPVITTKLNDLRLHFESTADAQFYSLKQGRVFMRTLVVVAIAFNLLLIAGVGLVVFIERNITCRLSVLVENTRRLAARQPLLPRVGGNDEIAHLDRVFADMAAALERATIERERMERLKQEFVSMISHDLRTPLTSIQMFLSMLARGMYGEVSEKVKDKSTMADRNATRLIGLINDLLDMEKMEAGELKLDMDNVNAFNVIEESLEAVRGFADKCSVTLQMSGGENVQMQADSRRLVQVLVNLLSNAVKFSPADSCVSITVEDDDQAVTFKVSDQGRGVPEQLRAAIFERFKQVEAKDGTEKNGTGLGLSICKAIVEGHGGAIGVISQSGSQAGSVFWFTVPKARVAVGAVEKATV